MFNARTFLPHPSAFVDAMVARASGSLQCSWQPLMAHPTVSFPIRRGVMR